MTGSVGLQLQAFNVFGYTFMLTLDFYQKKKKKERKKEKNSFRDCLPL